jgi:hypothetical protein
MWDIQLLHIFQNNLFYRQSREQYISGFYFAFQLSCSSFSSFSFFSASWFSSFVTSSSSSSSASSGATASRQQHQPQYYIPILVFTVAIDY